MIFGGENYPGVCNYQRFEVCREQMKITKTTPQLVNAVWAHNLP